MPRLSELAQNSLSFEDVQSGVLDASAGLYHLLSGTDAWSYVSREPHGPPAKRGFAALLDAGFVATAACDPGAAQKDAVLQRDFPWLFADGGAPPALPQLLTPASNGKRSLVVLVSNALRPPWELDDESLLSTDPTPWSGGAPGRDTVKDLVIHQRERLAYARRLASGDPGLDPGRMLSAVRNTDEARGRWRDVQWLVDAAHSVADRQVGQLLDALKAHDLMERCSVVITATSANGVGHRFAAGPLGLERDQVQVPLIWRLPPGLGGPTSVDAPVLLSDLAATLQCHVLGTMPESSAQADLLGSLPKQRERLSFAWCRDPLPFGPQPGLGGVRWSKGPWTLLEGSMARALFDRVADPDELMDVARMEESLHAELLAELNHRWWGEQVELQLFVKGRGALDLVELRLSSNGSMENVEGIALEPVDLLQATDPHHVELHLGLEQGGDGVRCTLMGAPPALAVELSGELDLRLYLGRTGLGPETLPARLHDYNEWLLRARVENPGQGLQAWVADKPPGVYLWLLPAG